MVIGIPEYAKALLAYSNEHNSHCSYIYVGIINYIIIHLVTGKERYVMHVTSHICVQ